MRNFLESSCSDLYKSAIKAFPNTTKRQNAIDPIVIKELRWTPFVGMKTMLIRGLAENTHENTMYNTLFLFKNIDYDKKDLPITVSTGKKYEIGKVSFENNDVLLRCNCKDFKWRFNYYNHLDKSLYGRKRAPYYGEGAPANPMELPGMCKHLMKTMKVLYEAGLFQ